MFVLFLQNFQTRSLFFYAGIISVICVFSFMLGSWAGPAMWSVVRVPPAACSVVPHNTSLPQEYGSNCTAGAGVVWSVSYSFPFSAGVGRDARWLRVLLASIHFKGKADLEDPQLKFEARLMYLDKSHPEKKWLPLAYTEETRKIYCSSSLVFNGSYGCTNLPLFQLLSVNHDAYRLDIRFFGDCSGNIAYVSDMNPLEDFRLVLRHERVPFSQAKAYLKAFFCPLTLFAHLWFHEAHRPFKSLLERVLYAHSAALAALNIPFEYFLMWIQCPMWTLFLQATELVFQSTLFLTWIVFHKFLFSDGQLSFDISSCRLPLSLLLCWCGLGALDGIERKAIQEDAFYTPWEMSFSRLREAVSFELFCSTATLFVSAVLVFQLYQMYSKISSEKSVLVDLKANKCLGYYKNSAFAPFSVCLFSCLATIILQYTLSLLLGAEWKLRMWDCEGCLSTRLLCPALATLLCGGANVLSVCLLMLTPTNVQRQKRINLNIHCKKEESDEGSLHCMFNCQMEKPTVMKTVTKVEKELLNMLQLWIALEEDLAKEEEKFIEANKTIV